MSDAVLWGIHAGRTGNADAQFLKQRCVAIGWDAMGDLSKLPATREAFKERYVSAYPDAKKVAVATVSGIPFRFLHEMSVGDLVAYPSKLDKQVHVGRVTGEYEFDPSCGSTYPHRRAVAWLRHVPRLDFS